MVITEIEQELITDPEERKKLRDKLAAEYTRLTGFYLTMIEQVSNKRNRLSHYRTVAKRYLLDVSSEYFQVRKEDIIGQSRKANLVKCRHMISYLLFQVKLPKEHIGKILDKDHSTIIHGIDTVKGYLAVDEEYKEQYEKYKNYCIKELDKKIVTPKKLTPEQTDAVLYSIKKGGITYRELAQIYEVSIAAISAIGRRNGKKRYKNNQVKK